MPIPSKLRPVRLTPLALALHCAVGAALAAGLVPHAHAQAAAAIPYDIPAGPLAEALNRFAQQSGVALVVDAAKVEGMRTPGLKGSYGVEEGFGVLLRGSGYAIGRTSAGYLLAPAPRSADGRPETTGDAPTLPTVQVTATGEPRPGDTPAPYAGGQVARGARLGLLGNTDIMDSPVSTTSYTARTVADQQARSLADVLVLDPGIRTTSSGGAYETFYIRGFQMPAIPGDIAFNGVYGLVPDRRAAVDYAERIEVLKGPSALLAGMAPGGGVGGIINLVPKRADDVPLTRLSAGVVSKSQFTTSADIGRRFGDNNEWGVRVNGAWREGDTPKDGMSKSLGLAALALDYRGERLRMSLDVIEQRDRDKGNSDLGVAFSSAVVARAPDASTSLVPGGFTRHDDRIFQWRGEYDLSPDTTVRASYGQRRSTFFALAGLPFGFDAFGNGLVATAYQRAGFDVNSAEAGITTRFQTGSVKHSVAVSVSALDSLQYYSGTRAAPVSSNLYNPVPLPFPSAPPATAAKFDYTQLNSLALADTVSLLDDRLLVTLGARHQQVRVSPYAANGSRTLAYDKSAVTPMLGIVYKASQQVSLYANYIEGLSQGPTAPTNVPGLTNPGQIFAPIKTKQREVGVKFDTGSIGATLSYFDIRRPNAGTVNNVFGLLGEQQNRGLELSVFGEAAKGLRVLGGMTFIDPKINGRTSLAQGAQPTGVPKFQANVGVEWDSPFAPGLTFTLRNLYTAAQFLDAANTQRLPSWTRWDAGLRYATKAGGRPVTLRASVENLFNRSYYTSVNTFASMGAPRTFVASVTVDF